jgi:FkbM family methyltransferase
MSPILQKLMMLIEAKKKFKNWIIFPFAYYNLIPTKFIIFKTKTNKTITIRKNSTDFMALTNVWLFEEYKKAGFGINQNDVIIDIGSHIGLFTLYASQYCTNGRIYSYEPIKENFELLSINLEKNNLEHVKKFNCAVSKTNTFVKIFFNKDEAGHSMFSKTSKEIEINSITLQKIFDDNKIKNCDFLKLDCEGAEYEIINTLPDEYFKRIKKIVMEYHLVDSNPELIIKLKEKLISQMFKIEIFPSKNGMGMMYAKK